MRGREHSAESSGVERCPDRSDAEGAEGAEGRMVPS
jgi:hypothetical protein